MKAETRTGEGMPETQRQGVQMQPPGRAAAVDRIPNDRMADVSQMGTELVGAAGQRSQPELSAAVDGTSDTPDRAAAAPVGMTSVARRLALQPGQWGIKAAPPGERTIDFGQIELVHPALGEEGTAAAQALQPAGQQQNARGVPVEAVNQMQIAIPRPQPCDQRVLLVCSQPGLTEQSSRLVHRQQPRIPMQRLQRIRGQGDRRNA